MSKKLAAISIALKIAIHREKLEWENYAQFALTDTKKIFIAFIAIRSIFNRQMMARIGFNAINAQDGFMSNAQMFSYLEITLVELMLILNVLNARNYKRIQ